MNEGLEEKKKLAEAEAEKFRVKAIESLNRLLGIPSSYFNPGVDAFVDHIISAAVLTTRR